MKTLFSLSVFLCVFLAEISAQIPYYTIVDTAKMREVLEKKIMFEYSFEQPFDSVTGKLKTKVPFDTTYTLYDRNGHEVDFSFKNEDGSRSHGRFYYDSLGRVIRHFSYDGDSTNGFVDYWTYNEKGQLKREVTYERTGEKETPFYASTFFYDDAGKLIVQKSYIVGDDGEDDLDKVLRFNYPDEYTVIEVGIENGDTVSVDTTVSVCPLKYCPYAYTWCHYSYRYSQKLLVARSYRIVDSLGARVKTTYNSKFYDYSDGSLKKSESDTTFTDRNDHTLESYADDYIEKYFYDDRGEFEYMIHYNRQNQPLYRRTNAYTYYQ